MNIPRNPDDQYAFDLPPWIASYCQYRWRDYYDTYADLAREYGKTVPDLCTPNGLDIDDVNDDLMEHYPQAGQCQSPFPSMHTSEGDVISATPWPPDRTPNTPGEWFDNCASRAWWIAIGSMYAMMCGIQVLRLTSKTFGRKRKDNNG